MKKKKNSSKIKYPAKIYLQEEQFIPQNNGLFLIKRRSNKGIKQMGSESRNLGFGQNAFFVKTHQVEDLVEGVLLPFEVIGLLLRQLLLGCRKSAPLLEGERKDVLAYRGD